MPKYLLNLVVEFLLKSYRLYVSIQSYMICLVGQQPVMHKVIPSFSMVPKWFFLIKLSGLVISGCL